MRNHEVVVATKAMLEMALKLNNLAHLTIEWECLDDDRYIPKVVVHVKES